MKKLLAILLSVLILASVSCKAKKCADFSDPQRNYKAKYDKNGLIKTKQKKNKSSWNKGY